MGRERNICWKRWKGTNGEEGREPGEGKARASLQNNTSSCTPTLPAHRCRCFRPPVLLLPPASLHLSARSPCYMSHVPQYWATLQHRPTHTRTHTHTHTHTAMTQLLSPCRQGEPLGCHCEYVSPSVTVTQFSVFFFFFFFSSFWWTFVTSPWTLIIKTRLVQKQKQNQKQRQMQSHVKHRGHREARKLFFSPHNNPNDKW